MTFNDMRVKSDLTLIAYRARILHNLGYTPHCISKKLNVSKKRVLSYLEGVYCIAKTPTLPRSICPKSSDLWGVPVLRTSCSKERIKLHSLFHSASYIPKNRKKRNMAITTRKPVALPKRVISPL